jgi:hypothetical protein
MTIAKKVWKNSHRFGCTCTDSEEAIGPSGRYSDGSRAPCYFDGPCPTASVEWNAVRAAFAQADGLKRLGSIVIEVENVAVTHLKAMTRIAEAIES